MVQKEKGSMNMQCSKGKSRLKENSIDVLIKTV